jgi:hypothetical protein
MLQVAGPPNAGVADEGITSHRGEPSRAQSHERTVMTRRPPKPDERRHRVGVEIEEFLDLPIIDPQQLAAVVEHEAARSDPDGGDQSNKSKS